VTPLDDFIIGRLRGVRRLNSQWALAFACASSIQMEAGLTGRPHLFIKLRGYGRRFRLDFSCRDGQAWP